MARRLPGVTDDGGTGEGDNLDDDLREGGDDGKRPRVVFPTGTGWFPDGSSGVRIVRIWWR